MESEGTIHYIALKTSATDACKAFIHERYLEGIPLSTMEEIV